MNEEMYETTSALRSVSWVTFIASVLLPVGNAVYELGGVNRPQGHSGELGAMGVAFVSFLLCFALALAAFVLNGINLYRSRPVPGGRYAELALFLIVPLVVTPLLLVALI